MCPLTEQDKTWGVQGVLWVPGSRDGCGMGLEATNDNSQWGPPRNCSRETRKSCCRLKIGIRLRLGGWWCPVQERAPSLMVGG